MLMPPFSLAKFLRRPCNEVIDEIVTLATRHGLTVNIMDPEINTGNIDVEPKRLNILTDADGVICSLTLG